MMVLFSDALPAMMIADQVELVDCQGLFDVLWPGGVAARAPLLHFYLD